MLLIIFLSDLGGEQSHVLSVILTLTECPVTCNALINEETGMVLELCSNCLVLEHPAATSRALGILTKLVTYCYLEQIQPHPGYMEQINLHIESLIYASLPNEKMERELKQYLKYGVCLSQHNREFGENFVEIIGELLTNDLSK